MQREVCRNASRVQSVEEEEVLEGGPTRLRDSLDSLMRDDSTENCTHRDKRSLGVAEREAKLCRCQTPKRCPEDSLFEVLAPVREPRHLLTPGTAHSLPHIGLQILCGDVIGMVENAQER